MKYLNHDFSLKERIIVSLLSMALLAVVYVYFVKIPLDNALLSASNQQANIEIELNTVNTKLSRYQRMADELENSSASYMPSYNASKKEVTFLDSIFNKTLEYGVKFTNITREGNLIRRKFYFSFIVASNSDVETILDQLINCEYRCLVEDITCVATKEGLEVTGNAIFYETLVDGMIDAALPADSLAKTQTDQEQLDN